MRSFKPIVFLCSLAILFSACQKDDDQSTDLDQELQDVLQARGGNFQLPASTDLQNIPQDPKNPLTVNKIALGKLLYHETGLALAPKQDIGKGTFSCASCHFASAGFQAGRIQGIADGGIGFGLNGEGRERGSLYGPDELDVQPVRTPSAMNGAFQKNMLWNGQFGATGVNVGTESQWTSGTPIETNFLGYEGLEIQAIAGLEVHRLKIDTAFLKENGYTRLFDQAFPDWDESDRYSQETAGLAIAAYERTLMSNEAPFQQWLRGSSTAMSDVEKRGAILFFDKAGCVSCHNGPALNSMEFHAYGMYDLFDCPEEVFPANEDNPANTGRMSFTGNSSDKFKFKVPQLYNLADSPFYGHGSSFRSVRDVVDYKNKGVKQNERVDDRQLSQSFRPLGLSDGEVEEITAFLTHALRDENLKRYEPSSLPSGNCFPFNDPKARQELGCN